MSLKLNHYYVDTASGLVYLDFIMTSQTETIYTFEHFRPAFPLTGDHVVIHRGTFEDNRESFSPSLVRARDFYATNDADALSKGQQAAATIPATFQGFNSDD